MFGFFNKKGHIPNEEAEELNNKGNEFFRNHMPEKAIDYYSRAIAIDSYSVDSYYNRGLVYSSLKDYKCAINDFNVAINCEPKDEYLYWARLKCFIKLNDYVKAIKDYNRIIKLNPRSVVAYKGRADAEFRSGLYRDAIRDYTNVLNRDFSEAHCYYYRGSSFNHIKEFDKAIDDFNKTISLLDSFDGEKYLPYIGLASIYQKINEPDKMKENIEKAKELGYGMKN